MTSPKRRSRGQPLAALSLLLGLWVIGRVVMWEPLLSDRVDAANRVADSAASHVSPASHPAGAADSPGSARKDPSSKDRMARIGPMPPPPLSVSVPVFAPVQPVAAAPQTPMTAPVSQLQPLPKAAPGVLSPRIAAAHQMAWLAAVAQLPLPAEAMQALAPAKPGRMTSAASPAPLPRWSADGWLLLRQGGAGSSPAGALLPSLGASQVGGVVRYRLQPGSAHRPALYLRASSALRQPRGEEVAAGLALRPMAQVPIAAMAEARLSQTATGARVRPAAALVSELPPVDLPGGLRGETYVQAGYVGGAGATAFVDGQARIEAPLASVGQFHLRAGAGAWGGAQQGASRLDVGPTATLTVPLGEGGGRLSADWRFRVAGNAAPSSGPALTLSAGF